MIGICIGVGKGWTDAALLTAARMSEMTGLDCVVYDQYDPPCAHPSWLKCHVIGKFPQHDSFLVFDADILPLKPWKPETLFTELGRPFCGCPDRNWTATKEECVRFNLPWPDCYLNGGLLMFGKEHKPVWDYVWRKHPRYGAWLEQTAMNEALVNLGIPVCRLPRHFNQLHAGSTPIARANAVNLHLSGTHNAEVVIGAHRRFAERQKDKELVVSESSATAVMTNG